MDCALFSIFLHKYKESQQVTTPIMYSVYNRVEWIVNNSVFSSTLIYKESPFVTIFIMYFVYNRVEWIVNLYCWTEYISWGCAYHLAKN